MKLNKQAHFAHPWRVHTLAADFELIDVWRFEVRLDRVRGFDAFLEVFWRALRSVERTPLFRMRVAIGRAMGWEDYFKGGSKLSDEVIAALEGVEADWIGRARALLAVLNPASRKLIRENLLEDPSAGSPTEPAHPNQGPRLVTSAQGHAKNKGNNDGSEDFGNIKKPLKKRISKNEEKRGLLEDVAFPLTRLWNKRTIQEAQALVEKALPVILSRQMKGPQVKALVKWVSTGNPPEAFGQAHLSPDPQVGGQALVAPSQSGDGYGATQAGSVVNPSPLAGEVRVRGVSPVKAVGASMDERPNQQPEVVHQPEGLSMVGQGPTTTSLSATAPIGAPPRNDSKNYDMVKRKAHANSPMELAQPGRGPQQEASAQVDLHSQVGTAIASHELGKRLHLPTQLMNQLLPPLTRLFHRARGLFTGLGIKNPTLGTFLTLLLFLFAGSALINLTGRLMKGFVNGIFYVWSSQSATEPTFSDPGGIGKPLSNPAAVSQVVSGSANPAVPTNYHSELVQSNRDPQLEASGHLSPGPQAGGQSLVVPSRSAEVNGGTKGGSVHLSPGPQAGGQSLVVPSRSAEVNGGTKGGAAQTKQVPHRSESPTPAQGGDVLAQIGAGVKNYQSAVNTADQAKSATDKVKGLLPF